MPHDVSEQLNLLANDIRATLEVQAAGNPFHEIAQNYLETLNSIKEYQGKQAPLLERLAKDLDRIVKKTVGRDAHGTVSITPPLNLNRKVPVKTTNVKLEIYGVLYEGWQPIRGQVLRELDAYMGAKGTDFMDPYSPSIVWEFKIR